MRTLSTICTISRATSLIISTGGSQKTRVTLLLSSTTPQILFDGTEVKEQTKDVTMAYWSGYYKTVLI
uniref:Secreted protein n=1 Tax=Caenorhabditis tropicalis TaxID=1561998 RepID=A0A1I7U3A5_9PELO